MFQELSTQIYINQGILLEERPGSAERVRENNLKMKTPQKEGFRCVLFAYLSTEPLTLPGTVGPQ